MYRSNEDMFWLIPQAAGITISRLLVCMSLIYGFMVALATHPAYPSPTDLKSVLALFGGGASFVLYAVALSALRMISAHWFRRSLAGVMGIMLLVLPGS